MALSACIRMCERHPGQHMHVMCIIMTCTRKTTVLKNEMVLLELWLVFLRIEQDEFS